MKKKITVFLLSAFTLFQAFAVQVTVSDAVESSKANSISLAIAKEQLEQSLRSASTLSSYLPDLSLKGTLSTGGSLASMSYTPFSADISAGISWSIGTSMIGNEESAAVKRTLAELEFIQSTESVETATVSAYLTLARSESTVRQAERKAESLKASYETQVEKYEGGLASELSVLEAESSLKSALYSLSTYRGLYELSLQSFRTLTGIEGEFTLQDFDEMILLDLPSPEELYDTHRGTITALKVKDAKVTESEVNLKTTKVSSLAPSLEFSTGYSAGASSSYTSSLSGKISDDFYVKVSVSVPVTPYIKGSSGDTAVRNAESAVTVAKLTRTQSERDTISSIASLVQQVKSGEGSVTLAEESLSLAGKTLELKKEAYDAGLLSYSEYLSAEDALFNAAVALSDEKISYTQQLYSLSSELGISVDELITLYGRK
ncbi:MAG: TolC family protein [Bullifex sp.]